MLFPAQSIGVDQPSFHSSGQLSHHGTKSRRLEAKVAECCRIRIKCGCPGFFGLFSKHVNTGINKVYWLQAHNRDSCSKALNLTPATIHLAQVEHIWCFINLLLQNCL